MIEKLVCKNCGKVLSVLERSYDSPLTAMNDSQRRARTSVCPNCGGLVRWVDVRNNPLSFSQKQEERRYHSKEALKWFLVTIALTILFFLVKFSC
jgi:predicted RNA-binding Zn-ribbon protein involved in translation (DUF1610 family)